MILLWGLPGDAPLARVYRLLQQMDQSVLFLDQRRALSTTLELSVAAQVEGVLSAGDLCIELGAVTAAYLRPYDSRRLPDIATAGPGSPSWVHALALEDALTCWAELTCALVVNRPSAMTSNNSKPYQAALIQSHGLLTPDTLITTDPRAASAFWGQHGRVIYKSISGIRSVVSRITPEHLSRLDDIVSCPTQFQQYVPGDDYRAHIVGDEIFACKISSEADDYRYAARWGSSTAFEACELPDDIASRCRALAVSMEMPVVGIDLRCTPAGEWYCFEVNPSPGYTYFQDGANQPIGEAIARLLARAPAR